MKAGRWISLILAGVTAVSLLAGCGAGTEDSQDSSAQTAQEDTDTQAAEEETDEGTGTSGKPEKLAKKRRSARRR